MLDLKLFNNRPWLLEPNAFRVAVAKLNAHTSCFDGRQMAKYKNRRLEDFRQVSARAVRAQPGKVAVLPIFGPIDQRTSSALRKSGGTSCEEVHAALDAIEADKSVSTAVLWFDSGGGTSYGVEELSDRIFSMRGSKNIYAMFDSMACSAAYWIASAAETLICTPGGDGASVGVYCAHIDESKALEAEGLTVTLVKAGKYKADGASFLPLSEEAKAFLQESVNETYDKFVGAVARNRGVTAQVVRDNYGQGRSMSADKMLAAGVIDKVMDMNTLMARLTAKSDGGKKAASTEILRLRHQHEKEMMA